MSLILPPKSVVALDEAQKLHAFLAREQKVCRDNPDCKCGHYSWCASAEIKTPTDWRAESLSVSERVSMEYKAMARKECGTIPAPKPTRPQNPTTLEK